MLKIFKSSNQVKHRFEAGRILGLLGESCITPDTLVLIPSGEFIRGSEEEHAYNNEKPVRSIHLDVFEMGVYPVTNFEFSRFLEAQGYQQPEYWDKEGWEWLKEEKISEPRYWQDRKWNLPNFPVVGVNWYEANAYTQWLSTVSVTGASYRLPTEAEREKAARGTDARTYPWGNRFDVELCNSRESGFDCTSPVGLYPLGKSPYECQDMAGNVLEWCMDWYEKEYYKNSPQKNPRGPESGVGRVVRGGGWGFIDGRCRASCRDYGRPGGRVRLLGFRVSKIL
jgi:sulfatase modifying factor 1